MKKMIGAALVMLMTSGCAIPPIDQTPPYRKLVVNKPAQVVFEDLTRYPYCAMLERTTGYWRPDGSFLIKRHHTTNDVGTGGVIGRPIDDNRTLLTVHTLRGKQSKEMERYITRLQTGSCK